MRNRFPKCPLQSCCVDNWTWDKTDKSPEIFDECNQGKIIFPYIDPSDLTYCKYTIVRGTKALGSEKHYWAIKVENSCHIGIAFIGIGLVKKVDINCKYDKDNDTDVLMKHETRKIRDRKAKLWLLDRFGYLYEFSRGYCKKPFTEQLKTPAVIGVLLDINLGTLSYYKNGVPLGVAVRGINYEHYDLFPCVMGINGTRMTLGRRFRSFNNLQDRCRATIMREIYNEADTDLLPIPKSTKRYLNDDYNLHRGPPKLKRRQNVKRVRDRAPHRIPPKSIRQYVGQILNVPLCLGLYFIFCVFAVLLSVAYTFLDGILF